MLVYWIWLAHRTGVSDRMKAALLAYFRDPEAVYFADEAALEQIPELTAERLFGTEIWALRKKSWRSAIKSIWAF